LELTLVIIIGILLLVALFAFKATIPYLIGGAVIGAAVVATILTAKTGTLNKATMTFILIMLAVGFLFMFVPSLLGHLQNLTVIDLWRQG